MLVKLWSQNSGIVATRWHHVGDLMAIQLLLGGYMRATVRVRVRVRNKSGISKHYLLLERTTFLIIKPSQRY